MRANDEIFDPARYEGVNFVPYSKPLEYVLDQDGNVKSVLFDKYLPVNSDPDNL
jgi:NADPH-dependent glutamate synthase beta subunit-like oxidoreductase